MRCCFRLKNTRAGSSLTTDLFGEEGYFEDVEQFWSLQNAAIAAERETLIMRKNP